VALIFMCFLLHVLTASSITKLIFTSYPNNPRNGNEDQPLQRLTSWGRRLQLLKVTGRGGDAEPRETCASAVAALFRVARAPEASAAVKQMLTGLSTCHQRISQISFPSVTQNLWQ